jgi:hypothetical protein
MKSLQDKARKANVEFKISDYFKYDWLSISASILTIILFLFFLKYGAKRWPQFVDAFTILFAFIGYTGSDVASRLFSVVNKKINSAIDYKTTVADTSTDDLENPTPLPGKKVQ